ncbi:MAG: DUF445 domain-containing protein [Selenomonadaceae bacterium]|nr:DUF445 domain-containing protein [Selenomonadaceae bacterium]
MNRWNNADTTLTCAALCFLAAAGFKILHPESIFAEGFLFVTEAAMVGGIADWFAVTALFKKPLGFPFHTAILPNRRKEFIDASVEMVQREFFSRRTIFKKIGGLNLLPLLVEYLEKNETKKFLLGELLNVAKNYFSKLNKENLSKTLAKKIRREFSDIPIRNLIDEIGNWIKTNDKDKEFFVTLIKKLRGEASKPEVRAKLQKILEEYAQEKTKSAGLFSILAAGLAQMLDFVNFEEAADIMQQQLLKFLDELSKDSPLQRKTINECRLKISEMTDTKDFQDLAERLQIDLANELPLEKAVEKSLLNLEKQISSAELENSAEKNLGGIFVKFFSQEYDKLAENLKSDGELKKAVEKFIYELAARTALYAQPMVGSVAKSALEKMTEDQLNSMVYDKAEKDFVWIRQNGSIMGAAIGLGIFILIKLAGG